MKNFHFAIALLLSVAQNAQAQNWHDNVWLFGKSPNDEAGKKGGSMVDFGTEPPTVSFFELPDNFDFQEISMVSDSAGNLLFYTDGCRIINREHMLMENGDTLNPGVQFDAKCDDGGYPTSQASIVLKQPDSIGLYWLFHLALNEDLHIQTFYYTVFDSRSKGGIGRVVSKNNHVFETLQLGEQLTAVRHANGRDWWLVIPHSTTFDEVPPNRYYKFLFTPQGLSGPFTQEIGDPWGFEYYSGQATFSPDGSKYARMNPYNGLRIFDFDRCSGDFSNPISIFFPQDTITSGGVAFSPNSRYLYVSAGRKLYQFDTWSVDVESSKQMVAYYDGFMSPLWTLFFQQMLAPDGKIYITCPNSVDVLHIIHHPDQPGTACGVEQHGLSLPTLHDWSIPNFPHYRLYDLPGSPCDTLGIDTGIGEDGGGIELSVFPNPASGILHLSAPGLPGGADFRLYAPTGSLARTWPVPPGQQEHRFPLGGLAPGLYYWQLVQEGRAVGSGKVVVVE